MGTTGACDGWARRLVCAACFAEGEDEVVAIAPPPPLGVVLARPLPVLFLFGPYAIWLALGVDVMQLDGGYYTTVAGTAANAAIVSAKLVFFLSFVAGWIFTPVVLLRTMSDIAEDIRRTGMESREKGLLIAARAWRLLGYGVLLLAASYTLSLLGG